MICLLLTEIAPRRNGKGSLSAFPIGERRQEMRKPVFFRSMCHHDGVECPMARKTLIGHVCWASAAIAAFFLGSVWQNDGSAGRSGTERLSPGKANARKTSSGSRGRASTGGRSPASGARRAPVGDGRVVAAGGGEPGSPGQTLSDVQIEAIANEAFRDGNPLVRRQAFDRFLAALTADNASELLGHLKENRVGGDKWRDFHYAWGMIDGKAAVEHATKSEDRDLSYTMAGWASSYPEAAIAHLNNLPEEDKRYYNHLQEALVSGIADNDTTRATDYVLQLANQGNERANHLFGVVTREVVHTVGIDEAARWSESLPDGELKGAALDSVAHRFTNRDPEAAAQWVEQFVGQSFADRAIEEVGDEWAERDPASAVNWLETLSEGRGQSMGLHSAFGEWAQRDPVAAGERISNMQRSPQRDAAISGYSRRISYTDPGAAIEWANSIAEEGSRVRALTHAGQQLTRRDRAAAEAWVAASGLPPEAQQAVLNPPQNRRR